MAPTDKPLPPWTVEMESDLAAARKALDASAFRDMPMTDLEAYRWSYLVNLVRPLTDAEVREVAMLFVRFERNDERLSRRLYLQGGDQCDE